MQLAPPSRRRGLGRDLAVIAGASAALAVVVALAVWLLVPAAVRPGFLGGTAGAGSSGPVDVHVDRVITGQADGRTALGSFTLRMRSDGVPQQLRTGAGLPPTPVPDGPGRPRREVTPRAGSAEALVRDGIAQAVGGLTYQQTAGEAGKERLRQTVKESVNRVLPGAPVEQVFIREYLVQ